MQRHLFVTQLAHVSFQSMDEVVSCLAGNCSSRNIASLYDVSVFSCRHVLFRTPRLYLLAYMFLMYVDPVRMDCALHIVVACLLHIVLRDLGAFLGMFGAHATWGNPEPWRSY